jgi:Fe-S oxidoreductase
MKMDTKEVIVEGTKVIFQIMANDEHKKMLKDMKMKENIETLNKYGVKKIVTACPHCFHSLGREYKQFPQRLFHNRLQLLSSKRR